MSIIRALIVQRAVLLITGDKSGNWHGWYNKAIPLMDDRYDAHLAELEKELRMTMPWDEAKRRADDARRAAGHHVRTDAERAAGQRRLDDEIPASGSPKYGATGR